MSEHDISKMMVATIIPPEIFSGSGTIIDSKMMVATIVSTPNVNHPEHYQSEKTVGEFMDALRENINYWHNQPVSELHKLEGVTFSILNMLDGTSCSFKGNIKTIYESGSDYMLHECFYKKKDEE